MTAPALDAMATLAKSRDEVLYYVPPTVRRERGPAVTFVAMPGGAK